jgi:hypothetical protein
MSERTTKPERLAALLDDYAHRFWQGAVDESLPTTVAAMLPKVHDVDEFRAIGRHVFEERFLCIPVDTMIGVLRRWVALDPNNAEARKTLGSYLLMHGPDWDEEGRRLLTETNAS